VAMPEVFFVNVNLREGINTDQITSARRKLVSSTACSSCSPLWTINDCLYNCVTLCALHRNDILIFLSRSVIPPVSRSNLVFVVLLFLCHALFCLCYTVFFFVILFCFFACITLFSVDYVTFSSVTYDALSLVCLCTEVFLLSINGQRKG